MTIQELLALLLSGNLSEISDEDLAVHEATLSDEFDARRPNARGAEALAELAQIVDAVDAVRDEAAARIQAAADDDAAAAALEERLRPVASDPEPEPEPEGDPEPEPEEPEAVVEEPVLVTAGAAPAPPAPVVTRVVPRTAPLASVRSDAPPASPAVPNPIRLVATPGVEATRLSIAEAFIETDRNVGMAPYSMNHRVFTVRGQYPENRRLDLRNPAHNEKILGDLFSPATLTAAGGALTASAFCGPPTPYYALAQISSAKTPFHDGIGGLSVSERGKLAFNRPFGLSDFSGAIGIWDDDDNEDAEAEKNCDTIECATPAEAEVVAFTRCLTIRNFFARYNAEMVAQAVDLTVVNSARQRETWLLDQVKAASTQTVSGRALGTVADFAYTLGVAAAGYRNASRMDEDAPLVSAWPAWIIDAMAGDLARAAHSYADQLRMTRAQVEEIAANLNVRLIFYIDSPSTGTSQLFTTQGVGNLVDYPEKAQWGLWHEGAHVVLDGGPDLNFGIVRDAVSNRANVYQTFGESFEGYAFLGLKSLWNTQDICPSGTFSAPADVLDDVCGGSAVPGS
jgi:hypothetical protein